MTASRFDPRPKRGECEGRKHEPWASSKTSEVFRPTRWAG